MNDITQKNYIQWDVAEVLEYDYTYAYIFPDNAKTNTNNLFSLKVRSCSTLYDNKILFVKPANNSIKRIPLVGELVLICKTFNEQSSKYKRRESWYYVDTVDLQSSVNENMLPGISGDKTQDNIDNTKPGRTFVRKPIAPLQPYEGDVLIEGRLGNSIRFGSTIDISTKDRSVSENDSLVPTYYYVQPGWTGAEKPVYGDPIIVLSNGRTELKNKQLTVENINTDASSLYLTSTQRINELKTNNPISNPDTTTITKFSKSQFIGVADRIILKSKTDAIIVDAKQSLELNSPKIFIGSSTNKEPMLHSTAVVSLFQKLIDMIKIGFADSSGVVCTPLYDSLQDASTLMKQLTNDNIQIDSYKS